MLCQQEEGMFRVRGSILNVVERMDEEYIKMLQSCDAHSTEYVDRCVRHVLHIWLQVVRDSSSL